MQKLVNFDVAIEPLGDGYRARVLSSPAGETQADFALPFTSKDLKILVLEVVGSIGRLRRNVRRIQSPERQMLEDFGGQLFQAVFSGPIKECLSRSRLAAETEDAGLRIRLRLPPSLANIPWEYLYDADYGGFVSLSPETALVRYLEMPSPVPPLPVSPPLRILAMISAPADVPELQGEEEWSKLTGALDELSGRGLVQVDRLESGSLAALQRPLRLQEYHVLHFVGHGGFNDDAQDGALALEGADGMTRLVTGRDLGMMIRGHRSLRLVVLNACEGARGAQDDPFGGVAQALVRQGIPAVIAMQFEISDPAALTFSQSFYQAIADGLPVDVAVVEARRAMFAEGNEVEWATPVLYLRAPDGRVFTADSDVDAGRSGRAEAGQRAQDEPGRQERMEADRRARDEAERVARDLATRYTLACAAADAGDWDQALVALTMLADVNPGYRDVSERLEHARKQQRIASLQAEVRQLHRSGQWAAVVDAGHRLHELDPAAADPDGLVTSARAELAATEQSGRLESDYEAALRALDAGNWYQAVDRLERVAQVNPAYRATPALLERARRKLSQSMPRSAPGPSAQEHPASPGRAAGETRPPADRGADDARAQAGRAADEARAHADRGDGLYRQHKHADAEAAYRTAITLDPHLAAAHAGLGRVLNRRRKFAQAIAACSEAIRLDPGLAAAHARLGVALAGSWRQAEAEAACREAVRLDPALAEAQAYLGGVLAGLKRLGEAEAACREAIRLDHAFPDARPILGVVLANLKRFGEAEAACREAIRLDPAFGDAYVSLALALVGSERFAEAESACREAIRLDPAMSEAQVLLGVSLVGAGRLAEAEAASREAIRLAPDYPDAHFVLAIVLVKAGRLAEGEAACREAIRLNPAYAEAHEILGLTVAETNRLAEAEAEFREAIRLDPTMASAHNRLGVVLAKMKRFQEAEAACREAIRLEPGLAVAHFNLGEALFNLKRYREGEVAYREAARLDPAYRTQANLARVARWLNKEGR